MKLFSSLVLLAALTAVGPMVAVSTAEAGQRAHRAERHDGLCPVLGPAQSGPAVLCGTQQAQAVPDQAALEPGVVDLTDHAGARRAAEHAAAAAR